MVQGTGSDVGKSVITAALARIFAQEGYQVAPFKSQNMALNSYVTNQGGEIGRAQAVQAEAAKVEATVDMNPILLKPKEDTTSQVIVHGRPTGNMTAQEYFNDQQIGLEPIKESLACLQEDYQVIVLEGAGSPAEVNLREYDLVNMKAAELAQAPVILVADIERGGVFASIIGTLELLNEQERERIKGVVINKFRGDVSRLQSGLDYIEEETGVPVLGVIPYFTDFKIPEEDAIPSYVQGSEDYQLDIAVIKLPHLSNFTDFAALAEVERTRVRYVKPGSSLENPDVVILPGSKNTIEDLAYLYQTGCADEIIDLAKEGRMVVGICGGYQMLGEVIYDPRQVETDRGAIAGLNLLDIETTLQPDKITSQIEAQIINEELFNLEAGKLISGYEIHMGQTNLGPQAEPVFKIRQRSDEQVEIADGACSLNQRVWGTYLHGVFANDQLRRGFINQLRKQKGLAPVTDSFSVREKREEAYNKLAELVRENLDVNLLYEIMGL